MSDIIDIPGFEVGKNFEEAITKLENDIKSIADGKDIIVGTKDKPIVNDSDKFPIDHFFMDGVYIRKMTMFKDTMVIGAIHKHKHMCFLLEGHLTVVSASGTKDYVAPCYIISDPGEKRILFAHEKSCWYNTHKNPTNTKVIEELEKQIVALSYSEYKEYINNNK
tara:strand:- start:156 stop:650 length:495 start_codon:yes stop_codon:yes gene_type:complete